MATPVPSADRPTTLADRLRQLRVERYGKQTQGALARAFRVGAPMISMWENANAVPSEEQLEVYARIYCSPEGVTGEKVTVHADADLTPDEIEAKDGLLAELTRLRSVHLGAEVAENGDSSWHFPGGAPVRLVCGELPEDEQPEYTASKHVNHLELLAYADLDSMVELFGHIRSLNPDSDVRFLRSSRVLPDDLSSHLVLIGGYALNSLTRWVVEQTDMPVRQVTVPEFKQGEVFRLADDPERTFRPVFLNEHGDLVEDVGMLFRMRNPNNTARTLTICAGTYTRGVWGAVRSLTDANVRDANEAYLRDRFGDQPYCVLMRVPVFGATTATPDLTNPHTLLYEWSQRQQ